MVDIKAEGSSVIELEQVNQLPQYQRVTVKVMVLRVHKPQILSGVK